MEQQDILDQPEHNTINKPVLFLIHAGAAVCIGLCGTILSIIFFTKEPVSIINMPIEQQSRVIKEFIRSFDRYSLFNKIFTGVGLLTAAIISFIICRKYKIHFIFPISVFGFSLLVLVFITKFLIDYIGFLMPGAYIVKQTDTTTAGIVNTIFLLLVASALFFSKPVKSWWLQ